MSEDLKCREKSEHVYIKAINADGEVKDITYYSFAKMGVTNQNTLDFRSPADRFNQCVAATT